MELKPGKNYIDCTLGGGGYTLAIAEKILPGGKVLAIDLDEMAINNLIRRPADKNINPELSNIVLAHDNFKNLLAIGRKYFNGLLFDGIVLDLGLSHAQLDDKSRGFSFNSVGSPLVMNFGGQTELKAEEIVNHCNLEDLTKIFRDYGEEKFAYKIALAIIRERQLKRITTTDQLVKIICDVVPKKFQSSGRGHKIHPATKIFQALRLAVNQELKNLGEVLPQATALLKPGGRLVVISYHSLEDRIVKQYFKQESKDCLCPPEMPVCRCGHEAELKTLTRKVLRPTDEEVINNPAARSAKLRAAEKI